MQPLLSLQNVSFGYQTLQAEILAVHDLTFHIYPGQFIGLIGPSGCGKTTILSLIAGLLKPSSGMITWHHLSPFQTGYMLQKDHLFDWLTIEENIALGPKIHHQLNAQKYAWIKNMLKEYDLLPFAKARPHELSGGMRQRVALIRTLALEPSLMLLDEPFSALDYQTRLHVADDIYQILRRKKQSALLVTHDISEAVSFCDVILILSKRPAHVVKTLPINLTLTGKHTPLSARMAPEFQYYFNEIWEELNGKS